MVLICCNDGGHGQAAENVDRARADARTCIGLMAIVESQGVWVRPDDKSLAGGGKLQT